MNKPILYYRMKDVTTNGGKIETVYYDGTAKMLNTAFSYKKNGVIYLKSYDTDVAKYNAKTNKITFLWPGYSKSTTTHINTFVKDLAQKQGKTIKTTFKWYEYETNKPINFNTFCKVV